MVQRPQFGGEDAADGVGVQQQPLEGLQVADLRVDGAAQLILRQAERGQVDQARDLQGNVGQGVLTWDRWRW